MNNTSNEESLAILEYMFHRRWHSQYGALAADYLYVRFLFESHYARRTPIIHGDFMENSSETVRRKLDDMYEGALKNTWVTPKDLLHNCSLPINEGIRDLFSKKCCEFNTEYSRDRNLVLSFKDVILREGRCQSFRCGLPIDDGSVIFDKALMTKDSRSSLQWSISTSPDSRNAPVVLSHLSPYVSDIAPLFEATNGDNIFLALPKEDADSWAMGLIRDNGGMAYIDEVFQNDRGILIKASIGNFFDRLSGLSEYLRMNIPFMGAEYKFTRDGITKSFADRHCFSLIPSAYDMFEGGKENEVQVSVMKTREIPKAGTLDAVVLKLKNGVPLDEPRYFLSSSKLIKWLESEECSNGRSQTKAAEIAVIKCPGFSRKDYESHILRAIGSIPDWHGMDLDCLTYWIRHAALPQKKKFDSGSAANLIRWMLTEVIDCCPKGRSARTAEALRKEFEEMVMIDRSASVVNDTLHRMAADWIFRANQAVEESGMDMDRFRERLRNMTPEHGGKFTSSQMSHPVLLLLMTALGRTDLSSKVSKHMYYIKSCEG